MKVVTTVVIDDVFFLSRLSLKNIEKFIRFFLYKLISLLFIFLFKEKGNHNN